VQKYLDRYNFTPGQKEMADEVLEYFKQLTLWRKKRDCDPPPKALRLLVLGGLAPASQLVLNLWWRSRK
jgi:hypothetical protein